MKTIDILVKSRQVGKSYVYTTKWIHEWESIFKSSKRKEKLKKIFNI
jgi:hypothetical protein